MKDETISQLATRLELENIQKVLDFHAARLEVANSEMGAVQKSIGIIESDVAWLKKAIGKVDDRTWHILVAIIITFLAGIAMKVWWR